MLLSSLSGCYLKTRDIYQINISFVEYEAQELAYKAVTEIDSLTNEIWNVDTPVQLLDDNYLF